MKQYIVKGRDRETGKVRIGRLTAPSRRLARAALSKVLVRPRVVREIPVG